jgi:hypothetical protein
MSRARMHNQPGGLAQDQKIVVLKKDLERHPLRLGFDLSDGRLSQFHDVPRPDEIARARRVSVQPNESFANQSLEAGAGKSRQLAGEKTIQPQTGVFARDADLDHGQVTQGRRAIELAGEALRGRRVRSITWGHLRPVDTTLD